jgi:DNA-binding NtrC family response regulator
MPCRIVIVTERSSDTDDLFSSLTDKGHEVLRVGRADIDVGPWGPRDLFVTTGLEAVETCELLLRRDPKCAVIVVDPQPSIRRAIVALRAGASDFVTDPADTDAVDAAIRRVVEKRILTDHLSRLGTLPRRVDDRQDLLGESMVMRQVRSRVDRLKGTESAVLIVGESGTERDAVARILHEQSPRKNRPFVIVNSGVVSAQSLEFSVGTPEDGAQVIGEPTLLTRVSGGTLFLDEIEKMPPSAQARLMRALDECAPRAVVGRENAFDARLIAASSVDLGDEVAAGRFRKDLYERMSVVQVRLPPLRERGLDTLLLAQHFVQRFAGTSGKRVVGMTLGAARMLMAHDWPGNVRELGNWVEAAVALARHDHITESELLSNFSGVREATGQSPNDDTLMSWNSLEARHIASILEEAGGNKARAARLLGIDRKTLYRKLERYGLDAPERIRRAH